MPHDSDDAHVPGPELGPVTLTPTEIVPIRGLSPIEAIRRKLQRAESAAAVEGDTPEKREEG